MELLFCKLRQKVRALCRSSGLKINYAYGNQILYSRKDLLLDDRLHDPVSLNSHNLNRATHDEIRTKIKSAKDDGRKGVRLGRHMPQTLLSGPFNGCARDILRTHPEINALIWTPVSSWSTAGAGGPIHDVVGSFSSNPKENDFYYQLGA